MNRETYSIMMYVFSLWGIAVAIKAFNALRTNSPYVFGMWDGGAIRVGKRINKLGKQIKVVVGLMMAGGSIAAASGAVSTDTAFYFVAFTAILSIVSDFATNET